MKDYEREELIVSWELLGGEKPLGSIIPCVSCANNVDQICSSLTECGGRNEGWEPSNEFLIEFLGLNNDSYQK